MQSYFNINTHIPGIGLEQIIHIGSLSESPVEVHNRIIYQSGRITVQKYFEYVCLECGWMAHHSLDLLQSGQTFRCPYCKSVFGLVDDTIQLISKTRRSAYKWKRQIKDLTHIDLN